MRKLKLLVPIALLTLLGSALPGYAMRCGSKLVSTGDTKAEVYLKCGEPFFSEELGIETQTFKRPYSPWRSRMSTSTTRIIEQWTYNQGPGSFWRILTFKGDTLVRIDTGDRVHSGNSTPTFFLVSRGDTKVEILTKYGEPAFREIVSYDSSIHRPGNYSSYGRSRTFIEKKVERWTYDLGPGKFLKILTFRGGKLVSVTEGERHRPNHYLKCLLKKDNLTERQRVTP